MALTVSILHNPRCSKSRQTVALLEDKGIKYKMIMYLTDPPSTEELKSLQGLLGMPVIEFTRTGERVFKELGLTKDSTDAELIAAIVAHPILLERPIVIANGKAAIGRPPENVLTIL